MKLIVLILTGSSIGSLNRKSKKNVHRLVFPLSFNIKMRLELLTFSYSNNMGFYMERGGGGFTHIILSNLKIIPSLSPINILPTIGNSVLIVIWIYFVNVKLF